MILGRTYLVPVVVAVTLVAAVAGPAAAGESTSDKAILKAGVVTKADVPTGWTSKKPSADDDQTYKGIAECKNLRTAIADAKKSTPRARSRQFEARGSNGTTSARSTVYVFETPEAAATFLGVYQDPQVSTCIEKGVAKVLRRREGVGEPSIAPVTDLEGLGDGAIGFEVTIPVTADDESATFYIDSIAVRVGRAIVGFNLSEFEEPLSDGPSIVQSIVGRVAEAQASA